MQTHIYASFIRLCMVIVAIPLPYYIQRSTKASTFNDFLDRCMHRGTTTNIHFCLLLLSGGMSCLSLSYVSLAFKPSMQKSADYSTHGPKSLSYVFLTCFKLLLTIVTYHLSPLHYHTLPVSLLFYLLIVLNY